MADENKDKVADNAKDVVEQPKNAQANESREAADTGARTGAPSQNDSDPIEARTLETGFDAGAEGATHVVEIDKGEGGPRGFETAANGFVQGGPGDKIPVTLTDDEIKSLKRFSHLKVSEAPARRAAASRSSGGRGRSR